MAGIGADIKDVLDELGTSLTIYRYPGPTFIEEKCDPVFFPTHSSEFLRQFFSSITLSHTSQVVSGDTIESMGLFFLCTTLLPSYFEDEIVDLTAAFYRCNCVGKLSRYPQRGIRNADYVKEYNWSDIHTDVHALQYENVRDSSQFVQEDVIALAIQGNLLFLPTHVVVKEGDRWYPEQTNLDVFFKVSSIDFLRIDNVSICILTEDERE